MYVGPRISAIFSASDVSRYDSMLDVSDSTTDRFVWIVSLKSYIYPRYTPDAIGWPGEDILLLFLKSS